MRVPPPLSLSLSLSRSLSLCPNYCSLPLSHTPQKHILSHTAKPTFARMICRTSRNPSNPDIIKPTIPHNGLHEPKSRPHGKHAPHNFLIANPKTPALLSLKLNSELGTQDLWQLSLDLVPNIVTTQPSLAVDPQSLRTCGVPMGLVVHVGFGAMVDVLFNSTFGICWIGQKLLLRYLREHYSDFRDWGHLRLKGGARFPSVTF